MDPVSPAVAVCDQGPEALEQLCRWALWRPGPAAASGVLMERQFAWLVMPHGLLSDPRSPREPRLHVRS